MIFTRVATALSYLFVCFGGLRVFMGFQLASGAEEYEMSTERYLGSASTGEAIDSGLMVIFAGIVLGVLVEISRAVQSR